MRESDDAAVHDNPLLSAIARMETAIAAARAGDVSGAAASIERELATFPRDVNILHKAGVLMRHCADDEAALRYFNEALKVEPRFAFTEIEIGDVFAARGNNEVALRWYGQAIESAPSYRVAYIKAAHVSRLLARPLFGLELLNAWSKIDPRDNACNLMRAELYKYVNDRVSEASVYREMLDYGCNDEDLHFMYLRALTETAQYAAVIAHAAKTPAAPGSWLAVLAQSYSGHAKLALAFDAEATAAQAARREQSAAWRDSRAAHDEIREAIESRSPFSLIRLGDGEARFLTFFDAETRKRIPEEEASAILDLHWDNWFKQRVGRASETDLIDLHDQLCSALVNADMLGTVASERQRVDNVHRGYFLAQERFLSNLPGIGGRRRFTSAFINQDLHRISPFYKDLLAGLDYLGVVSPHPGLAARLARFHGVAASEEWVVPGEARLPEGVRARSGSDHFPGRYLQLMSELKIPRRGAVVLVAAGLLGKVYCGRIRGLGGVALDVGAIVDAWLGYATRPGEYRPAEAWTLPDARAGD